jgi:alpha-glucosidase
MRNQRFNYRFLIATPQDGYVLNATGLHQIEVTDAHDFVITADPRPPCWVEDSVFYQIFLDRFARSQDANDRDVPSWATPANWSDPAIDHYPAGGLQLYGGDLTGLSERLDHISELGANALYLTPFFPAPSIHRYDASTFGCVDPILGGDNALRNLILDAHDRGIRVLGDLTLNHTSVTHEWFQRALSNPSSEEAAFYVFRDYPHTWEGFDDLSFMPKLDHRSSTLRHRLFEGPNSVAARYVHEFGLDGWRIDVAQSAGHSGAVDRTIETARALRRTLAHDDSYIVAEHQYDAADTLRGDAWHGTMAYAAFTRPLWSWLSEEGIGRYWGVPVELARLTGQQMVDTMDSFNARIPWRSRVHSINLLDSHDTPRLLSIVSEAVLRVAIGILMTMPGIPMLFAGDEIGTTGRNNDEARQPFRWDSRTWHEKLFHHCRELVSLRRTHSSLRSGAFRWLYVSENVVIYERARFDETIMVLASRSSHDPIWCPARATSIYAASDIPRGGGYIKSHGPSLKIWRVEQ